MNLALSLDRLAMGAAFVLVMAIVIGGLAARFGGKLRILRKTPFRSRNALAPFTGNLALAITVHRGEPSIRAVAILFRVHRDPPPRSRR